MKVFRQINMNFFNTVFIEFFYHQTNSVVCDHFITGNRQAVQMFDDKTAKGIVILRIQLCIQVVVDIVQMHGTFNDIFPVGNFLDKFVFFLVVLVMDRSSCFR